MEAVLHGPYQWWVIKYISFCIACAGAPTARLLYQSSHPQDSACMPLSDNVSTRVHSCKLCYIVSSGSGLTYMFFWKCIAQQSEQWVASGIAAGNAKWIMVSCGYTSKLAHQIPVWSRVQCILGYFSEATLFRCTFVSVKHVDRNVSTLLV